MGTIVCCEEEEQPGVQKSVIARHVASTKQKLRGCSARFSISCCFPPPACAGSDFCKAWMERELKKDPSKLILVQLL